MKTPKLNSENSHTMKWALIILAVILVLTFFATPGKFFQAWINPASAADLSNGAFCMHVVNDKEPEINATAGNCVATPPTGPDDVALFTTSDNFYDLMITSTVDSNNTELFSSNYSWTMRLASGEIIAQGDESHDVISGTSVAVIDVAHNIDAVSRGALPVYTLTVSFDNGNTFERVYDWKDTDEYCSSTHSNYTGTHVDGYDYEYDSYVRYCSPYLDSYGIEVGNWTQL